MYPSQLLHNTYTTCKYCIEVWEGNISQHNTVDRFPRFAVDSLARDSPGVVLPHAPELLALSKHASRLNLTSLSP